jgi:hypothetical protein
MYPSLSVFVVLAEVAIWRTCGTILLAAGLVGAVAAGRTLLAGSGPVGVSGGALVVADRGPRAMSLLGLAAAVCCVVAGVALWMK